MHDERTVSSGITTIITISIIFRGQKNPVATLTVEKTPCLRICFQAQRVSSKKYSLVVPQQKKKEEEEKKESKEK